MEEWVMVWLGAEKEEERHKIAQSGPRKKTQKKEDKGQKTKKRTMASILCVIYRYENSRGICRPFMADMEGIPQ